MTLLILTGKAIAFVLFCMLSAFVILFGRNRTGIKVYYVFASIILWGGLLL